MTTADGPHLAADLFDRHPHLVLDTTDRTPHESAARIIEWLAALPRR